MDIQGPVITTYVYQLIENEVRVEKVEFRFVHLIIPLFSRNDSQYNRKDNDAHKELPRNPPSMPQNIPQSPAATASGW